VASPTLGAWRRCKTRIPEVESAHLMRTPRLSILLEQCRTEDIVYVAEGQF
jgi:hypothetical protein